MISITIIIIINGLLYDHGSLNMAAGRKIIGGGCVAQEERTDVVEEKEEE